jgi:hypothetical protein
MANPIFRPSVEGAQPGSHSKPCCRGLRTKTAPLMVEAESARRNLAARGGNGMQCARNQPGFPIATGSLKAGTAAQNSLGTYSRP